MEINRKLELARSIVEQTDCSLFLTGKAGTGKTTFLRNLRATSRKRMIVTAPTGIAAINAGGVTLHSFFQLDFGIAISGARPSDRGNFRMSREKIRMIRGLDLLVIDEMSMVRADLLDAVDRTLRRYRDRARPFGGVQLLMIGDLQQLPPVVTDAEVQYMASNYRSPYFFDSHSLENFDYITIELDHVYRQSDRKFLDLLNAVRDNRADASVLNELNSRLRPGFNPPDTEGYVRLTTHNARADETNRIRLNSLPSELHTFRAKVDGNFPRNSYPADEVLHLKKGAQVMFVKNDTGQQRRFYNGMLGTVTDIDSDGIYVRPTGADYEINVEPMVWENKKYTVNEKTKEISDTVDGSFTQIPLKLAWAITIHKSQGLTFDRAIIDASSSFTHGQTYVALSRCRTLEGLVLDRPIPPQAIINDPTVMNFINNNSLQDISDDKVESMSHTYYLRLASEMFNFRPIFYAMEGLSRIYEENFMRIFPAKVQDFAQKYREMQTNLISVGDRFAAQIAKIDRESGGAVENPILSGRIKDASRYFVAQLDNIIQLTATMPNSHDSTSVNRKLRELTEHFESLTEMRHSLLDAFSERDFNVTDYLDIKAEGAFKSKKTKSTSRKRKTASAEDARSADNLHPELLARLKEWRTRKAVAMEVPAYCIAHTKTLLAISNHLPVSYDDLRQLPGIGPTSMKAHGDDILDVVDKFIKSQPVRVKD